MRSIKTLVLHLYVDVNVPERMCGNIRSLEEDEGVPFKNIVELENILRRFIIKSPLASESPSKPDQQ